LTLDPFQVELVKRMSNAREMAEKLAMHAWKRRSMDHIAVLVLRLNTDAAEPAIPAAEPCALPLAAVSLMSLCASGASSASTHATAGDAGVESAISQLRAVSGAPEPACAAAPPHERCAGDASTSAAAPPLRSSLAAMLLPGAATAPTCGGCAAAPRLGSPPSSSPPCALTCAAMCAETATLGPHSAFETLSVGSPPHLVMEGFAGR